MYSAQVVYNLIPKGRSDLLQSLLFCLPVYPYQQMYKIRTIYQTIREEEIGDCQEECGACDKDIVVVLSDVGECTRARFSN